MENYLSGSNHKSVDQLTKEYPDSWVLLLQPRLTDGGATIEGGLFVYQSKQRTDVLNKVKSLDLHNQTWTTLYTGKIEMPENVVICL